MKSITDENGNEVTFLGRTGILFKEKGHEYFIDAEGLVGPEFGYAIYSNSVMRYEKFTKIDNLSNAEKENVVAKLIEILKANRIYFEVF